MRNFPWCALAVPALLLFAVSLRAEPVGLVLSGGGAKGAYEVGVWKALVEKGVAREVRVISGTSIGALNGALFASVADPDKVESLWRDHIDELLGPFVGKVGGELQKGLDGVADDLRRKEKFVAEGKRKLAAERGISVDELLPDEIAGIVKEAETRLAFDLSRRPAELKKGMSTVKPTDSRVYRTLLRNEIPKSWPDGLPRVYVTVVAKDEKKPRVFLLNEEPHERRVDAIAASGAFPGLFTPVTIDGTVYVDGGWRGGDNTPAKPILERHPEIKTIIVVYLDDAGRLGSRRIPRRCFGGRKVIEIIPSLDTHGLFGTIDICSDSVKKLIRAGYDDALKTLAER